MKEEAGLGPQFLAQSLMSLKYCPSTRVSVTLLDASWLLLGSVRMATWTGHQEDQDVTRVWGLWAAQALGEKAQPETVSRGRPVDLQSARPQ